jgi:hypothetical protein
MKTIFSLICFFSVAAFAKAPDYTIHQEYVSTRALGMGNAFIAHVDDFSSIFYNPATLAYRTDGHYRFFLRAGIDDGYMDFIDELNQAGDSASQITTAIENNYGEHRYARVPTIGGAIARPRWGLAFIPADLSTDIVLNNSIGPALGVTAYLDSTLAYSYARETNWIPKKRGSLAMGATLKAIHRAYYSDIINAGMLAAGDEIFDVNKSAEGMTIDLDIGFIFKPALRENSWFNRYMKPTFAFVGRNLIDYGFPMQFEVFNDQNPGEPPKLERRFDVGAKFELPKLWVFQPALAADIRDIGHRNWTFKKGSHIGAEMYWKMFNWWKGHWSVGLNQGYWTAGFGARLAWLQIDIASFGEEVGTTDAPNESRRYIAELALDF